MRALISQRYDNHMSSTPFSSLLSLLWLDASFSASLPFSSLPLSLSFSIPTLDSCLFPSPTPGGRSLLCSHRWPLFPFLCFFLCSSACRSATPQTPGHLQNGRPAESAARHSWHEWKMRGIEGVRGRLREKRDDRGMKKKGSYVGP